MVSHRLCPAAGSWLNMPPMPLLSQLLQWQQLAARLNIRLPVIWQGDNKQLISDSFQLLAQLADATVYWLGEQPPVDAVQLSDKHNYQLLGSECDVLVINAFSGFNADLVAASAGCVKAGGIWLLLCPEFSSWQQLANPAHKNLLPYPLDAHTHQGQFIRFWLSCVQQQNVIILHNNSICRELDWPKPPSADTASVPYATTEQASAVAAILHVVSGHRRRPLLLSADRGRGKSAALGIAAAQLAIAGKQLVLTAPSPRTATTALQHFQQLTATTLHQQLNFVAFDQLLNGDYQADLLLVDEAAAIPTPVLQQLVQKFSRVVFATTEHGYEGTGRGFQLRFQQHLNTHYPGWKKLHLHQPIRYQQADPLEQLTFNSFLLKPNADATKFLPDAALNFKCYQTTDWLNQAEKLQQVFSLLSLAHYQTQVKDLAALLDNPQLQVVTLEQNNQLLACALICIEGNIEATLANQIYLGARRLQGHLLAQSLAFHLAQPDLAQGTLWRVMRITVQPQLLRQKLGAALLAFIDTQARQASVSYLGCSFGVTTELCNFWRDCGYQAVRLGTTTDNASNEYSLLMLKAVLGDTATVNTLANAFAKQLFVNLTVYPALSAALVLALATAPATTELNTRQKQQLLLFAQGKRPYELIRHLLLDWFNLHYNHLQTLDAELLCSLLWQQHDLATVAQKAPFNGKKRLLCKLAEIVRLNC
uniref:GNAT family N-acetyltransferase n=1 Tax=Rheinheimera sp. TaxID=1869214 RepID=UPI0040483E66